VIPELGHLLLWLALAVALTQTLLPLFGAAKNNAILMESAPRAALLGLLLVAGSFACLTWSYWTSDFSVVNVVENSHTMKPALYKITGIWSNHEGSLLLWVLILSLASAAVAVFSNNLAADFRARALACQGFIATGFLSFLLFTSNPFARLDPAPLQGNGLNPILQDPGLAFHPPLLYCGYVGLSVAFSFAVAALIEGRIGPQWARWVRPWTLVAWSFLTLGIMLGSYWAYYELGWGSFWFWDPVENASLMPWLAATALFHSAIVLERRDTLKSWTVLLAILAFSLSLLGTFIVRSGVLTSVHAFAVDPARGLYILGFLGLTIGGALSLYAWRAQKITVGPAFAFVSRESGLLLNNLFLSVLLATIFIGTLYPLVAQAFGRQVSVGPPYFNIMLVLIGVPLLLAMAAGPLMAWRSDTLARNRRTLAGMAVLTKLCLIILLVMGAVPSIASFAGFAASLWLGFGVLFDLLHQLRYFEGGVQASAGRLTRVSSTHWGMSAAHFGFAIVAFAITATVSWQSENLAMVQVGKSVAAGGYDFQLADVQPTAKDNYTAIDATIKIFRDQQYIATVHSEMRTFIAPPMETTESGIAPRWNGNLYAVLGKPDGRGGWQLRVHWQPFVWWMWAGAALMALGGAIAVVGKRARAAAVFSSMPAAQLEPAE
jgi:cytochrome c-type biogenesis protein CcmF